MSSLSPIRAIEEPPVAPVALFAPGRFVVCALVTSLFFLWGIPNNLNDILIRQFMKSFALTRLEAGLVQSAFYLGYFLLALPAAIYMRRFGYKPGFLTGLLLFGGGTLLFWPAAVIGRYSFFLLALFIMAGGLAFLETASNTFIALAGPAASSERRLNLSQAFNPLGAIAGALIGTRFILSGVELSKSKVQELQRSGQYAAYLHAETLRVIVPYAVLGCVAFLLALVLGRTKFPVVRDSGDGETGSQGSLRRLLANKYLIFAVVAQFFYVGTQVGTWSYFIPYVQEYTGQSEKIGGYFLTGTLLMFGLGRFTSAALMKRVPPARLMAAYCALNAILASIAIFDPGWVGVWMIFVTSFFMSLMYPTIFSLALHGLGSDSKVGGSLLVMAIIGGAVLTPAMGILADRSHNLALAFAIPLLGYLVIACYAIFGHRRAQFLPGNAQSAPVPLNVGEESFSL